MTTPAPNLGSKPSWVPPGVAFTTAPGAPGTPGPPGMVQSTQISSNLNVPPGAADSSSTVPRPSMPPGPVALNSVFQPQIGPPYPSLPALGAPPQGVWLQPPQMGVVPRLPTVPYPAAFPGPFPILAQRGMGPSVPVPDSQPPGVTPVGSTGAIPMSSASSVQVAGSLGIRTELPASGLIWLCFQFDEHPIIYLSPFLSNDIIDFFFP